MNYTPYYKLRLPEGHDYYDVEDFNTNAGIIDSTLNKLANSSGGSATEQTITLSTTNWDENNQQTITVEGATENSVIILGTPTGVSQAVYNSISTARLVVLSTNNNTMVIKAYGSRPSIDISISVVVM